MQDEHLDAGTLLYERYKRPLLAFFINCTGDTNQSQDLVQLTFEKMVKYRSNYRGQGSFKSWLFSIARNVLKDFYQRSKKQRAQSLDNVDQMDEGPTAIEVLAEKDQKTLLRKAMAKLSPQRRETLALIKLEGMKYREVAELYQMKESTLKVNIFRTMKELKGHLQTLMAQDY